MRAIIPVLGLLMLAPQVSPAELTAQLLLRRAIVGGQLNAMQDLLSVGADPNARDSSGQSALGLAISFGHVEAVQLLLKWHADPNAPMYSGSRSEFPPVPLQHAARTGNLRLASLLLDAGAPIDARGPGGRTALHTAVAESRFDMLHLLLEKGANINTRDAEGASPLDDAAWVGSLDMTALLIAHGAPVNEPDVGTGATPISEAAFRGFTPVVRYLLQLHPDLTVADKRGFTALDNAVRMGKEDCALLLFDALPAGQLTHEFFGKAMEAAIGKDEPMFVAALLQHGADVNEALRSGSTPLDAAAFSGSGKTVRALLDHGADPNVTGPNENTPLEDASLKGFDPIVRTLLEHGARINEKNRDTGSTALYAAASFGRGAAVKALLEHGADAGLCGNNHKSPYQVAVDNHYPEVAAQLESMKACRP